MNTKEGWMKKGSKIKVTKQWKLFLDKKRQSLKPFKKLSLGDSLVFDNLFPHTINLFKCVPKCWY